jgi:predicted negative regulator of RcsB-dependent stress response
MENTQWIWFAIIIILLGTSVFFGYKYFTDANDAKLNDAFSLGYNKSLVDVSQGQAQTGSIILWVNDTIKVIEIKTVCDAMK